VLPSRPCFAKQPPACLVPSLREPYWAPIAAVVVLFYQRNSESANTLATTPMSPGSYAKGARKA